MYKNDCFIPIYTMYMYYKINNACMQFTATLGWLDLEAKSGFCYKNLAWFFNHFHIGQLHSPNSYINDIMKYTNTCSTNIFVVFISLNKIWQDCAAFKHVCLFQRPATSIMLVEDWSLIWCIISYIFYIIYIRVNNYKNTGFNFSWKYQMSDTWNFRRTCNDNFNWIWLLKNVKDLSAQGI